MGEWFGVDASLILTANLLLSVFLFVLIIVMNIRLSKVKKRHQQLLNGDSNLNIEQLMIRIQEKLNMHEEEVSRTKQNVQIMNEAMKKMKSKAGIHRYNAFQDGGSDLSFSIAILDDYQDGMVITGLHGREETFIYAKPIQKGESKYTLSPEEREAINLTVKQS